MAKLGTRAPPAEKSLWKINDKRGCHHDVSEGGICHRKLGLYKPIYAFL